LRARAGPLLASQAVSPSKRLRRPLRPGIWSTSDCV
jgi:hypothetical protein